MQAERVQHKEKMAPDSAASNMYAFSGIEQHAADDLLGSSAAFRGRRGKEGGENTIKL